MPYKDHDKQKAYQKQHYQSNKRAFLDRNYARRKRNWDWFYEATAGIECAICGEKERVCLDYHHIDPKTKVAGVVALVNENRSKAKVLAEIAKCIVLCSNCHRKFHAGIVELPQSIA